MKGKVAVLAAVHATDASASLLMLVLYRIKSSQIIISPISTPTYM